MHEKKNTPKLNKLMYNLSLGLSNQTLTMETLVRKIESSIKCLVNYNGKEVYNVLL